MKTQPPRALTLVEVLVALGLGVLLVAAVQGLIVQAYRASTVIEAQDDERRAHDLVFDVLRRDLDNLIVSSDITLQDGTLSFVTANAMQVPDMGNRHAVAVCYALEPEARASLTLLRDERDVSAADADVQRTRLAGDVRAASVVVFDGRAWQTKWPLPTPRPARALRLTITVGQGDRRSRVILLAPHAWRVTGG